MVDSIDEMNRSQRTIPSFMPVNREYDELLDNSSDASVQQPKRGKPLAEVFNRDMLGTPNNELAVMEHHLSHIEGKGLESPSAISSRNMVHNKDFQVFHESMTDFITELDETSKESGLNYEQILAEIFKLNKEQQDDRTDITLSTFKAREQDRRLVRQERLDKMRQSIEKAQKTKFFGAFENLLRVGSIATIVGTAAATGNVPLVVASVVYGIGSVANLMDSMLGDPVKKAIIGASTALLPIEKQQKESLRSFSLGAMKLGLGAIECIAALVIAPAGAHAAINAGAQTALNVAKTAVTGLSVLNQGIGCVLKYQKERDAGQLSELSFSDKEKERAMKEQLKFLENLYTQNSESVKKKMEMMKMIHQAKLHAVR